MSKWTVCKTTVGRELHNAILSGVKSGPLKITRIVAGRGDALSTQQLLDLSSRSDIVTTQTEGKILYAQEMTLCDATQSTSYEKAYSDDRALIVSQLTNDINNSEKLPIYGNGKLNWNLRHIVIFAQSSSNGDDECVFLVAQDSEPDKIPTYEDNVIYSSYSINLLMKDALDEYKDFTVDISGFVPYKSFEILKERMNDFESNYLSKSGGTVTGDIIVTDKDGSKITIKPTSIIGGTDTYIDGFDSINASTLQQGGTNIEDLFADIEHTHSYYDLSDLPNIVSSDVITLGPNGPKDITQSGLYFVTSCAFMPDLNSYNILAIKSSDNLTLVAQRTDVVDSPLYFCTPTTDLTNIDWLSTSNADTIANKGITSILAQKGGVNVGNDDFNDLKEIGVYNVGGSVLMSEDRHQPKGVYQYGTLIVFKSVTYAITQLYCSHRFEMWYRTGYDDNWNEWRRANDGGNADTVDSLHDVDLNRFYDLGSVETDINKVLVTGTYKCTNFKNYPKACADGQGILKVENYMIGNASFANGTMGTDNMWLKQYFTSPHDGKTYERFVSVKRISDWQLVGDGCNASRFDGKSTSDFSLANKPTSIPVPLNLASSSNKWYRLFSFNPIAGGVVNFSLSGFHPFNIGANITVSASWNNLSVDIVSCASNVAHVKEIRCGYSLNSDNLHYVDIKLDVDEALVSNSVLFLTIGNNSNVSAKDIDLSKLGNDVNSISYSNVVSKSIKSTIYNDVLQTLPLSRTEVIIKSYNTPTNAKGYYYADYTCTSTNAREIIQQAINECASGSIIRLLQGTYNIDCSYGSPITISKDVTIIGCGYSYQGGYGDNNHTILMQTGEGEIGCMFEVNAKTGVIFKNLHIVTTQSNNITENGDASVFTSAYNISCSGVEKLTLDSLTITYLNSKIPIICGVVKNVRIANCNVFTGATTKGVMLELSVSSRYTLITNNMYIENGYGSGSVIIKNLSKEKSILIDNNINFTIANS